MVSTVRQRKQVEKRHGPRIDLNRNAPGAGSFAAGARVIGGGQQALMGKSIGYRSNRSRRLYFTKPLIVCEEESAIVYQRSSDACTELITHERRDGLAAQVKVVLRVEGSVSVQFKQRSMKAVAS